MLVGGEKEAHNLESLSAACYNSMRVAIRGICSYLCEAKANGIEDLPHLTEQAVRQVSYRLISFQRKPKAERCFPNVELPWIGSDGTTLIHYFIDEYESDMSNSSTMYVEQLSMGVVLAHAPSLFLDDHLTPRVNFDSFRRDWPQLSELADEVCEAMKGSVGG